VTTTEQSVTAPDVVGQQSSTSLRPLFSPTGIAVIGASTDQTKLGGVMAQMVSGYAGHVALVNPRGSGMYASIAGAAAAAPCPIELAVLCVPAAACPEVLVDCARAGVRAALVCAGGFAEIGGEGVAMQTRLLEVARHHGVRLLGPNTSGFFVPEARLLASFVPGVGSLQPGGVGLVAASGGLNHALAFALQREHAGLRLGVGIGAGIDVAAPDVLDYLAADDATSAIALHLENVADGDRLLTAVATATSRKPVVAMVVGQHDIGEFAQSHTGALATSWRTTRALLRQAGAVLADDVDELVVATSTLSRVRAAPQRRGGVALVTGQAGPGLIIADAWQGRGVSMPTLTTQTQHRLADLLPPMTYQANPVDTGRPGPRHDEVMAVTAEDPQIDVVAVYSLVEPVVDLVAAATSVRSRNSAVVLVGMDGPAEDLELARHQAEIVGLPLSIGPRALAVAASAVVEDAALQARIGTGATPPDGYRHEPAVPSGPLTESAVKDLLHGWGIVTPPRRLCRTRTEARAALESLGGPVAMKISDASVLHKSDIGGVKLGLRTDADVDAAFDQLMSLSGTGETLVEKMAPPGVDLIVGARRDPVFGPIVLIGVGGTATEVYADIAVAGVPAPSGWLRDLPDELTARTLLDGHRGTVPVDRVALGDLLTRVGDVLIHHPEISEIEINPLRATADGLIALDAVLLTSETHPTDPDPQRSYQV
jgi:acetyltransferase